MTLESYPIQSMVKQSKWDVILPKEIVEDKDHKRLEELSKILKNIDLIGAKLISFKDHYELCLVPILLIDFPGHFRYGVEKLNFISSEEPQDISSKNTDLNQDKNEDESKQNPDIRTLINDDIYGVMKVVENLEHSIKNHSMLIACILKFLNIPYNMKNINASKCGYTTRGKNLDISIVPVILSSELAELKIDECFMRKLNNIHEGTPEIVRQKIQGSFSYYAHLGIYFIKRENIQEFLKYLEQKIMLVLEFHHKSEINDEIPDNSDIFQIIGYSLISIAMLDLILMLSISTLNFIHFLSIDGICIFIMFLIVIYRQRKHNTTIQVNKELEKNKFNHSRLLFSEYGYSKFVESLLISGQNKFSNNSYFEQYLIEQILFWSLDYSKSKLKDARKLAEQYTENKEIFDITYNSLLTRLLKTPNLPNNPIECKEKDTIKQCSQTTLLEPEIKIEKKIEPQKESKPVSEPTPNIILHDCMNKKEDMDFPDIDWNDFKSQKFMSKFTSI